MDDCTLKVLSGRLITAIGVQTTACHSRCEAHKSIQVDCVFSSIPTCYG